MSIADLRQRQKGRVWALTNFEVPEKAGALNTLAILADESGYFFAELAGVEGQETIRGSSTISYRHSENPTLTYPAGRHYELPPCPSQDGRRSEIRDRRTSPGGTVCYVRRIREPPALPSRLRATRRSLAPRDRAPCSRRKSRPVRRSQFSCR
jgi:hypothetical protein